MKNSFYTSRELYKIGFGHVGKNVLISKKTSIYSPEQISIGNHVRIDDFTILSGEITLGSYIHIAAFCALYGKFGIELRDCTGISPHCLIFSATDDFSGNYLISPMVPKKYTNVTGGKVVINRLSQIGAGSVIMPSVTINEGVAVGAMSLIKKNLDSWSIYAGNPARFIKKRDGMALNYYNKLFNNG